jgi:hypothetical protein
MMLRDLKPSRLGGIPYLKVVPSVQGDLNQEYLSNTKTMPDLGFARLFPLATLKSKPLAPWHERPDGFRRGDSHGRHGAFIYTLEKGHWRGKCCFYWSCIEDYE